MSSAITLGGRWERKQITAVVCFAVCVLASVVLAVVAARPGCGA